MQTGFSQRRIAVEAEFKGKTSPDLPVAIFETHACNNRIPAHIFAKTISLAAFKEILLPRKQSKEEDSLAREIGVLGQPAKTGFPRDPFGPRKTQCQSQSATVCRGERERDTTYSTVSAIGCELPGKVIISTSTLCPFSFFLSAWNHALP